jgi:hypothetical protein
VETQNEYAVFVLDPIYVFDSPEDCIAFMNVARERTLRATFLPKKIIKSGGSMSKSFVSRVLSHDVLLARNKVVRIWERAGEDTNSIVTLTFHDRTKDRLTQWALDNFADYPLYVDRKKGVELSRIDHNEQFVFFFDSELHSAWGPRIGAC